MKELMNKIFSGKHNKELHEYTDEEWNKRLSDFTSKTLTKEDLEKVAIKSYEKVI